jgi:3-dehydroquinate dehydratase-2
MARAAPDRNRRAAADAAAGGRTGAAGFAAILRRLRIPRPPNPATGFPPVTAPVLLVLNGPNLDRLGTREPAVYGRETLADIEAACRAAAEARGYATRGVAINAGAYTHTSVALHDALRLLPVPIVEVHLSNVYAREAFRHRSFVSPVATGIVMGFGGHGYVLAIEGLAARVAAAPAGA